MAARALTFAPVSAQRTRLVLLLLFVAAMYLPWGVSYRAHGERFSYEMQSGMGSLIVLSFLTLGLHLLPLGGALLLFLAARKRGRSHALVWICRGLLLVLLAGMLWVATAAGRSEIVSRIPNGDRFLARSGVYLGLVALAAAIAFEIYVLFRRGHSTTPPGKEPEAIPPSPDSEPDVAAVDQRLIRRLLVISVLVLLGLYFLGRLYGGGIFVLLLCGGLLIGLWLGWRRRVPRAERHPPSWHARRAGVLNLLAVPAGLLGVMVGAAVSNALWGDSTFYAVATGASVCAGILYARVIAHAMAAHREGPPAAAALARTSGIHAAAQIALGASLLLIGPPAFGWGASRVPEAFAVSLLVVVWGVLPVFVFGPGGALPWRWLLVYGGAAAFILVLTNPLLTWPELTTIRNFELAITGAGWGAMQALALASLGRVPRTGAAPPKGGILAGLPAAVGCAALFLGVTLWHVGLAGKGIRI